MKECEWAKLTDIPGKANCCTNAKDVIASLMENEAAANPSHHYIFYVAMGMWYNNAPEMRKDIETLHRW